MQLKYLLQIFRQLLLQPPLLDKIIMGIDPGFVSGFQSCGND